MSLRDKIYTRRNFFLPIKFRLEFISMHALARHRDMSINRKAIFEHDRKCEAFADMAEKRCRALNFAEGGLILF